MEGDEIKWWSQQTRTRQSSLKGKWKNRMKSWGQIRGCILRDSFFFVFFFYSHCWLFVSAIYVIKDLTLPVTFPLNSSDSQNDLLPPADRPTCLTHSFGVKRGPCPLLRGPTGPLRWATCWSSVPAWKTVASAF